MLVEVPIASPPEDAETIARAILDRVTPRTRLVVLSQMTYLLGQILPVALVAKGLEERGIPLLVDAAHGIALLPDTLPELRANT